MCDVSERSFRDWVTAGKVKKVGRGAIDMKSAFEFNLHREVFDGGSNNSDISDEEVQMNKALLEKAKADLAELEVGIEKRAFVNRRELGGYMVNEMVLFKRELLALSRIIPSGCYGMSTEEVADFVERKLQIELDKRLLASEIGPFLEATEDSK